jgi:radical SAM protein with 4Fe4S-binding SPASM domain
MDTAAWKRTLDLLWSIGIPHIVFTGGEPTLRPDLPELIAHAENLGQITGINTNGRNLKDPVFVQSLVDAGLDHVQITLESHNPAIHDHMVAPRGAWNETVAGLRNALATRLFVMTNTTLLQENAPFLSETLDFLADLGVPTIGLNALIYSGRGSTVGTGLPESALPPLLDLARNKTEAAHQRLIWYTPTQYCNFDPVQMDLGVKGCSAALYNMCVEPDGSVLPCQSYYTSLGNILTDSWQSIWQHDLAVSLREHRNLPDECHTCALLSECGGGCPLARTPITAALPAIP